MPLDLSKSIHRASFTHAEFNQLCREFPEQRKWLESIVNNFGPKAVIDIKNLHPTSDIDTIGKEFYDKLFSRAYVDTHYLREGNFLSVWHQLKGVLELPKSEVESVLEIGKGIGLFNALVKLYDYEVQTLDVDETYKSDLKGNILDIPCEDNAFDIVCAFEVLQHLPSAEVSRALREMVRVARHYVYLSLPCSTGSAYFRLSIKLRQRVLSRLSFDLKLFRTLPMQSQPDRNEKEFFKRPDKHNPHYWEVGTRSFPKKRIITMLNEVGLKVIKDFHNPHHPYHWFLMCKRV